MFEIAICDDDKKICVDLKKVLNQIAKINDYDFNISIFNSGEDLPVIPEKIITTK